MVKVVVKDALGAGITITGGSVWSSALAGLNKASQTQVWLDESRFRQTTNFDPGDFRLVNDFHRVSSTVAEFDSTSGYRGSTLLFTATGISYRFDPTNPKSFRPDATVFKSDDQVFGNRFNDNVRLGAGNDRFQGNAGEDEAWGQAGHDTLIGGVGIDVLLGGLGNDSLLGGDAFDLLIGGEGQDKIYGGAGGDNIDGEGGRDFLTGGAGSDTFFFQKVGHSGVGATKRDVITDFDETDRIDLRGPAEGLQFSETGPLAKGIWITKANGMQIVNIDTSGDAVADMQIAVEGVALVASSFQLSPI